MHAGRLPPGVVVAGVDVCHVGGWVVAPPALLTRLRLPGARLNTVPLGPVFAAGVGSVGVKTERSVLERRQASLWISLLVVAVGGSVFRVGLLGGRGEGVSR